MRSNESPARAQRPAFTLVELLVVIGIIAVLIGIFLPVLGRARENANQVKCMANLRTIGQAMVMYVGESKGTLPYGFADKDQPIQGGTYRGETSDWTTLLANVLNKKKDIGYGSDTYVGSSYQGVRATFACPTVHFDPSVQTVFTHYSAHPRVLPNIHGADRFKGGTNKLVAYKLSKLKRSSEIAVIFDASIYNPSGQVGQNIATACAFGLDANRLERPPYLTDAYSLAPTIEPNHPVDMTPFVGGPGAEQFFNTDHTRNRGNIRFRHKNDTAANVLMADGHVTAFQYNKKTRQTDMVKKNIYVNP